MGKKSSFPSSIPHPPKTKRPIQYPEGIQDPTKHVSKYYYQQIKYNHRTYQRYSQQNVSKTVNKRIKKYLARRNQKILWTESVDYHTGNKIFPDYEQKRPIQYPEGIQDPTKHVSKYYYQQIKYNHRTYQRYSQQNVSKTVNKRIKKYLARRNQKILWTESVDYHTGNKIFPDYEQKNDIQTIEKLYSLFTEPENVQLIELIYTHDYFQVKRK